MFAQAMKSKTILFALALEVLGVVQLNADFLSTVMSPAQFGWVMLGIGVAIKVLRTITTTSLSAK